MTDEMVQASSRLVVYSNKPPIKFDKETNAWIPNLSGGAVRVILGSPVSIWIGPGEVLSDEEYAKFSPEEKFPAKPLHIKQEGKEFDVYSFPVPQSLHEAQYESIANRLFWPIHHSQDPDTFEDPMLAMNRTVVPEKYVYSSDLKKVVLDFAKYKQFNAIATEYLTKLRDSGVIHEKDRVWIHDYQCTNVGLRQSHDGITNEFPDKVFSFHIPFPPLSYLKRVFLHALPPEERADGKDELIPLLQTHFFREYMEILSHNRMITFQRPVDQQNFFETLAYLDPSVWYQNDLVYRSSVLDGYRKKSTEAGATVYQQPLGTTSLTPMIAFDRAFATMNLPVGTSQEENLRKAISHEDKLTISRFDPERLKLSGLQVKDNGKPITIDSLLGTILRDTSSPHHVFFSAHRNDYTKCTMEKLVAAQAFLERNPSAVGKAHFVFFLEPTRGSIVDYQKYEEAVLSYATKLHKRFGNSIMVIPQKICQEEVMGILRQPNVVALLGVGQKDGHDLTLREAADAQADRVNEKNPSKRPKLAYVTTAGSETDLFDRELGHSKMPGAGGRKARNSSRLAVVTTTGTGASDVLHGAFKDAFIVDHAEDRDRFIDELERACSSIYRMNQAGNLEGRKELEDRYRRMAKVSEHYSGERFGNNVREAIGVITGTNDNIPDQVSLEPAGFGKQARPVKFDGTELELIPGDTPERRVDRAKLLGRIAKERKARLAEKTG